MSAIMNDDAIFQQDMIYYQSFHNNKEVDVTQDFLNNRFTFTELLSSEPIINESYDFAAPQQQQEHYANATPCSSPESEYALLDETKIKIEYDAIEPACQLYTNPARSLSIDSSSCPELAVCNPANISVASFDSPPPTPTQQHHQIHEIYCCRGGGLLGAEFMDTTTSRGMHHHPNQLLMQEQDYQSIVTPLPSPPTTAKAPGKSRGRRMSNKPTKPGTKCFECTYAGCGRIFKRSEHLKRHVRSIHTLERPFHCPYAHCSKRFSRSDNLSQHIRVHRPNGKDKHQSTRMINNNFTPFLQTYHRNGNIHSSISN